MTSESDQHSALPEILNKYYSPKMIRVGTFLGGPVAAGYFIGQNYKAFGQRKKIAPSWIYSIIATALLSVVLVFVPSNEHNNGAFKYIIPLLYSWAAFSLVKYLQTNLMNEHVSAGGTTYGWGRVILISLIACIASVAILFGFVFVLITLFPSL